MARVKMPNPREAVILRVLIGGERYGLEIRDEYMRLTGEELPLGSLYTTLERMATNKKFLTKRDGEPVPGRRGNRPRYYRISATGRSALNAFEIRTASAFGLTRMTSSILVRGVMSMLIPLTLKCGGLHD